MTNGLRKRKITLLNAHQDVNVFPEDIPRSQGSHILAGFDWFDGFGILKKGCFTTYKTFKRIYSVLRQEPSGFVSLIPGNLSGFVVG